VSASGGYQLVQSLGTGVGGAVYLAEVAGRKVAIRQFVSTSAPGSQGWRFERQRFLEAGRRAETLKHPRIVPILEVIDEGSEAFVAMEYMPAETLRAAMAARSFTLSEANTLLRQIAMALDFAHEHGVVHGDVKPGDIFLDAQGAKVSDFAISPRAHLDPGKPIAPTLLHGYLSPEHIRKPESVNARSDQFALGVIAYELYTGHSPYGEGVADLGSAILNSQIHAPSRVNPQVPPEADAPLMRALAADPSLRFGSCMEFVARLGAEMITQPDAGPRSPRGWLIAAALFVLAAGAGGYMLWSTKKPASPAVAVAPAPAAAHPATLPVTGEATRAGSADQGDSRAKTKAPKEPVATVVPPKPTPFISPAAGTSQQPAPASATRAAASLPSSASAMRPSNSPTPPAPAMRPAASQPSSASATPPAASQPPSASVTRPAASQPAASVTRPSGRSSAEEPPPPPSATRPAVHSSGEEASLSASAARPGGRSSGDAKVLVPPAKGKGGCSAFAENSFQIEVFSGDNKIHDGDNFQVSDSLLGRMAEGDLRATVMPTTGAQIPRGDLGMTMEWRENNTRTANLPVPAMDSVVVYGNKPTAANYSITLLTKNRCQVGYFHFRITPSQP